MTNQEIYEIAARGAMTEKGKDDTAVAMGEIGRSDLTIRLSMQWLALKDAEEQQEASWVLDLPMFAPRTPEQEEAVKNYAAALGWYVRQMMECQRLLKEYAFDNGYIEAVAV